MERWRDGERSRKSKDDKPKTKEKGAKMDKLGRRRPRDATLDATETRLWNELDGEGRGRGEGPAGSGKAGLVATKTK